MVRLYMEKTYAVGVDVGGQTTKIGIVGSCGEILARTVIRSDIYGSDASSYVDALAFSIRELIKECGIDGRICGIGVGAPNGNHFNGCIQDAPNLAWASGISVRLSEMLSSSLDGIPVSLTNDADAAAVGEMTFGAARGMRDFIMITLGTGVGSGIVIDGRLVYGHDGFAGELGHVTAVQGSDRLCGCGRYGCLETYCSAIGIVRTAKEMLETRSDASILRDIADMSSKDIFDAAKKGDALAKEVFDVTGTILGRSFADFVAFSAPEAIVLFGGLARAKEYLLPPVRKAMDENLLKIWKGKVKIVFSELKESDAAILGASALVWEH